MILLFNLEKISRESGLSEKLVQTNVQKELSPHLTAVGLGFKQKERKIKEDKDHHVLNGCCSFRISPPPVLHSSRAVEYLP